MTLLRLELSKTLNQKRTYIGWVGLVLVPVIVVAAGSLQKPRPQAPGEPPFVAHVSQNGLLVMLDPERLDPIRLAPMRLSAGQAA